MEKNKVTKFSKNLQHNFIKQGGGSKAVYKLYKKNRRNGTWCLPLWWSFLWRSRHRWWFYEWHRLIISLLLETDLTSLLEVLRAHLSLLNGHHHHDTWSGIGSWRCIDHHIDHDNCDHHYDNDGHGNYDDDCHNDLFLGRSELCDVCVVALLHTPEKMTSSMLLGMKITLFSPWNKMKPEVNGPQDFELIILLIILLMKKLRVEP